MLRNVTGMWLAVGFAMLLGVAGCDRDAGSSGGSSAGGGGSGGAATTSATGGSTTGPSVATPLRPSPGPQPQKPTRRGRNRASPT